MTIREFAKLNNFPIRGKLTRIPDEVEYDFNDRPHSCKRYVDEDFNEYGIHEDGFIVAIPCEKAWGLSIKEKSRIAAMIEKERMEASQRRGSYEWYLMPRWTLLPAVPSTTMTASGSRSSQKSTTTA